MAVRWARDRSDAYTASNATFSSRGARARACAMPVSFSSTSDDPWIRSARFQSVSPWRIHQSSFMLLQAAAEARPRAEAGYRASPPIRAVPRHPTSLPISPDHDGTGMGAQQVLGATAGRFGGRVYLAHGEVGSARIAGDLRAPLRAAGLETVEGRQVGPRPPRRLRAPGWIIMPGRSSPHPSPRARHG